MILLFAPSGNIGLFSYSLEQSPEHIPVTSVRFSPRNHKNFIAVSSDGFIREWKTHNPSINRSIHESNNIFALDISSNGDKFAPAGLDKIIRLYDYETTNVTSTLHITTSKEPAHNNRVFSVKFDPKNQVGTTLCKYGTLALGSPLILSTEPTSSATQLTCVAAACFQVASEQFGTCARSRSR